MKDTVQLNAIATTLPTGWRVVVLLVVLLLARLTWLAVYRMFFHPLAKYPGPIAAKLSDFYMIALTAGGRATYARYELHQKYGKVVRMGPNELCFCDLASIKDIYGQSAEPCLKAPFFYDGFTLTGTSSVFSATDRTVHARMRRLLSHGFSERGVLQFQGEIMAIIEQFLAALQSAPSHESVNIHDLVHNLYLDTTSQLSFARSFHIIKERKAHQGAEDINTYFSIAPLYGILPIAKHLPFGIFRAAKEARPRIVRSVQSCLNEFRERLRSGTSQSGLLRLMVEAKDNVESDGETKSPTTTTFSDDELIENAVLFIIAGSGTTATTLLYLIYELGKRPELQKRLEQEIRTAFPEQDAFPVFETATQLPYLNSVVQETLRLRGPIPTTAPRISPGKMIGGDFVSAGVVVSNLAYSTQRDATVFDRPHDFNPDRWTNGPTAEMKTMNRPFSSGPRNCVGMHLARVQLLLTVCAFYQRFEIGLDRTRTTEEMMVMRDQGLMSPVGKQLWVHVRRRDK